MKKVNIFLSIGNNEVEEDKTEIINFIRHLNDIYEDYGLYFYLMTSKNEIKKEEITSSEIYMILFNNNVDSSSNEEFNIAYQEFKESKNKPKIYTYVKDMTKEKSGNALDFMKRLDKEIGHFYKNYNSTDTIKLNIIMQLQNLGLEEIKYETKENKLYLNNEEALSLENIPMFMNNKELNKLKEKYIALEQEKKELREKTRENPDDEEAFKQYGDAIRKFDEIKLQIKDLEKSIYEFEKKFIQTEGNETLTERQIYARECLERGDIEAAKKALDFEILKKDEENILDEIETASYKARILINEYMQSIDTLKLDINNPNRFKEIDEIYQEAISLEKKVNIERDSQFRYAYYLIDQNKNAEGVVTLEEYIKYCEYNNIKIGDNVYYFLGTAYIKLNDYKKCEEYLQKTISCIDGKTDINSLQELSYSYFLLAQNSLKLMDYTTSEKYYKKAIEILENNKKIEENELYHLAKSEIYSGYATLQSVLDNKELLFKYGDLAITEIDNTNSKVEYYNIGKGEVYSTIGLIYLFEEGKESIAEKYLLEAEKILKKEYEINSQKTTILLVDVYKNLGTYYMNQAENEKAKKYYKKCIKLCLSVDENNIATYENIIAMCKDYLARIYAFEDDYKNAEKNAIEANKYYLKYAKKTNVFNDQIVDNYVVMLRLYTLNNKNKKSLEIIEEAIAFIENNTDIKKKNIFEAYSLIAQIYYYLDKDKEAKKYAELALDNITESSELNDINECYTIMGTTNMIEKNYEEAIEYLKAQEELINTMMSDKSLLPKVYEHLEHCYNVLDQNEERTKYLELLIDNCDNTDTEKLLDLYDNLINNDVIIGNDDKVIEHGLKYEQLIENKNIEENNIKRLCTILNAIGSSYRVKEEYDKASHYLEKVEKILEKEPDNEYQIERDFNKQDLDILYFNMIRKGDYTDNECKEISKKAIHYLENETDATTLNNVMWHCLMVATIDTTNNEITEARKILKKALLIMDRIKKSKINHIVSGSIFATIGDTYNLEDNYKEAIKYYEKALSEVKKEKSEASKEYILTYNKVILEVYKNLKDEKNIKKYNKIIEKLGGTNG